MIKRVWDSSAGREPKKIKVIGKNSHCNNIDACRHLPWFAGRGGNSSMLMMADTTMPTMAKVIIVDANMGKLWESKLDLNFSLPSNKGSHAKPKVKSEPVAHDQKPSMIVKT